MFTQRAVLLLILDEHPDRLTTTELSKALNGGQDDWFGNDNIHRAVYELAGAGLLHHHGEFLRPSRAALHFERLELD
jgi:hypothetical protein